MKSPTDVLHVLARRARIPIASKPRLFKTKPKAAIKARHASPPKAVRDHLAQRDAAETQTQHGSPDRMPKITRSTFATTNRHGGTQEIEDRTIVDI